MPYRPFEDQNCSIARALAVVGERWTLLVLREVLLGRRRFQEIKRNTGVATNILTDRLETLVEHGVLERRRTASEPESHEYVPTRQGPRPDPGARRAACSGATATSPRTARRGCSCTPRCGHDAEPALYCSHCHEQLGPGALRVRPGPGATGTQRYEPLLPRPCDDRFPAHRRLQLRGRPVRGDRAARRRRAIAIASAASVAAERRRRRTPTRRPARSGSSRARTGFASGSPMAAARNGSAATAARRSSAAIPVTPIRSASAWARSTTIRGSGRASASSWTTPRRGSRYPTTASPATPRAATGRPVKPAD